MIRDEKQEKKTGGETVSAAPSVCTGLPAVGVMSGDGPLQGSAALQFEAWVKLLCPLDGSPLKLGNIEVWIDPSGPWAGVISYSLPTSQWDKGAVSADLAALVTAKGAMVAGVLGVNRG